MYKRKYWPSLWAISDGQYIVGSGYWPHLFQWEYNVFNITIKVKYLWFGSGYGPPDFQIWMRLLFFFIAVKDSVDCWLYKLRRIPCFWIQSFFILQQCNFLIVFVVVLLFVIISIASLIRTYSWLSSLLDRFWMFWLVWSNFWQSDCVLLTLS